MLIEVIGITGTLLQVEGILPAGAEQSFTVKDQINSPKYVPILQSRLRRIHLIV
jgi:hypothetical protein